MHIIICIRKDCYVKIKYKGLLQTHKKQYIFIYEKFSHTYAVIFAMVFLTFKHNLLLVATKAFIYIFICV